MAVTAETGPAQRHRHWRHWLRLGHRWFGLAASLWLLPLALTGSAITFYDELDRWLNPDWRQLAPHHGPPFLDAALAAAGLELPGFTPRFIDLPNRPEDAILMLGRQPMETGEMRDIQLFARPADGAVLGWRVGETVSLDRRYLMDTLYALHVDLMLGPVMTWVMGLVALFWVLDHGVAAALSFPARAKWRDSFRLKGRAGSLKRLFDLHRAGGLWLLVLTLMLAVTSLCLSWPEETRDAVRLLAPVSERLHEDFPDAAPPAVPLPLSRAIAIAEVHGGSRADSVLLVARKAAYGVRLFDERDIDGYGRLWIYVSMTDGQIMGQRHDLGEGAGDLFFAWQYPLHSGKGLGLAGRILIFLSGLLVAALCVTGCWLWWRRRRAR